MEEADGDSVDPFGLDLLDDRVEILGAQRRLDRPIPPHTLADSVDVAGWDERLRLGVVEIVELLPVPAGNRVDILEAVGRDEEDARATPLEEGVQADGGAVDDELDLARVGDELGQAGDHAFGRVARCAENLASEGAARLLIVDHEVGERATDVD